MGDEQRGWRTFGERTIHVDPYVWLGQVDVELPDEDEEPAEAAARELEEETGYRAGRVEHLITFQPTPGRVDSEHVVFVGQDAERIGEPTEATEAALEEWVPLASVPALIGAGDLSNAA